MVFRVLDRARIELFWLLRLFRAQARLVRSTSIFFPDLLSCEGFVPTESIACIAQCACMQMISPICDLRIVVGYLGEKAQSGWWDTAFLNTTGFRFLGLIYPRTAVSACVTAASEAACRAHDERIGKGRVAHLFRLASEAEMGLRAELGEVDANHLGMLCSPKAEIF